MNKMIVNLISDTVTKPTKEMLEFMMQAEVGDDVFGNDPTVNALQKKVAEMFGMEDALFFPTGTMANQTAINLHTIPGEQMICDKYAHVYNYEGGGAAINSGISSWLLDGNRGMFTANQLVEAINDKNNIHLASSSLVCVENTTNKGGGACWDLTELKKIRKIAKENDLKFHLDGARLFNALVAKNETPKQYGELFDTISICLSKGLGAPIGSVLIGSKADMKKALRIRKRFGGAMRQVGYLAAAGIYALDNHVNRLKIDHEKATLLAQTLADLPYVKLVEKVETNIVIFNLKEEIDENQFVERLKKKGILMIGMGQGKLRMVTHLDCTNEMITYTIEQLKKISF